MTAYDYWRAFKFSWVQILVLTVAGFLIAGLASLLQPPEYSATASLTPELRTPTGSTSELQQAESYAKSRINTYLEIASSASVVAQATNSLDANVDVRSVSDGLSVTVSPNTSVLKITATADSPELAADLANAIAESLANEIARIEQTEDGATSAIGLQVFEPAVPPSTQDSPNVQLYLALGTLIGFAVGIGIAVARESLNRKIRLPEDLRSATNKPIIGLIEFPASLSETASSESIPNVETLTRGLHELRTNLLLFGSETDPRIFAITALEKDTPTAHLTVRLATSIADAGYKVAIMDAVLDSRDVSQLLGAEDSLGLSDAVREITRPLPVINPQVDSRLTLLPAGHAVDKTSDVLSAPAMRDVIQRLENTNDVVLINCPPLSVSSDALLLGKLTGRLTLVAELNRSKRPDLEAALDDCARLAIDIPGIVLVNPATK